VAVLVPGLKRGVQRRGKTRAFVRNGGEGRSGLVSGRSGWWVVLFILGVVYIMLCCALCDVYVVLCCIMLCHAARCMRCPVVACCVVFCFAVSILCDVVSCCRVVLWGVV